MEMTKEQFEELCSAYAVGAPDKNDQEALFSALEGGGEEFQKIFSESVNISYTLNQVVVRATPSPAVKMKLLKMITKEKGSSFSLPLFLEQIALSLGFGSPRFGLVVALLLFVVVLEMGTYAFLMYNDILDRDQHIDAVESRLSDQQQRFIALQTELQQKEEILNILQSPKIEMVLMNGLQINPNGYGKIILPLGTVKTRIRSAMSILRQKLKHLL